MPRFVLPGITTNAALPLRPTRGFFDDFNRPNSISLGLTSGEYKAWQRFGAGSDPLGRIINGRATSASGTGTSFETVDAATADGTLRFVMGSVADLNTNLVLARALSNGNFLRVVPTPGGYQVSSVVSFTGTNLALAAGAPAPGDVVDVTFAGTSGSIRVNNGAPVAFTDAVYSSQTRFGFGWQAGKATSFESLQFQAA